jgi:hypothetical protein
LREFRSVVDAVRCAIEVQNGMVERNAGLPPERRIEFRQIRKGQWGKAAAEEAVGVQQLKNSPDCGAAEAE